MRGHYVFLMAKYRIFIDTISIIISGDIASYSIEILIGILAQTRMGLNRITFLVGGA